MAILYRVEQLLLSICRDGAGWVASNPTSLAEYMLCRDSQLSQVLERGSGNAVALAILYMEVCARVGLAMAARLLDGGRYVVLWPTDAPLRTCGQQFVVDAYSQGELFLLDEVKPA